MAGRNLARAFPEANRGSLEAMSNTLLMSTSGQTATLGSLSTITELPGQTEILRENLQRDVAVTARLEGVDLGTRRRRGEKAVKTSNCLHPFVWRTAERIGNSSNHFMIF